jgi:RNA-directed DNA polymerase
MTSIIPDEFHLNQAGTSTTILDEFFKLENFQCAWEKAAENRGCAGVDGESIDRFARNQTMNIY